MWRMQLLALVLESRLRVRVTVLNDAAPGERTVVRSGAGDWGAVWRGRRAAVGGQDYEVEVDVDEIGRWLDVAEGGGVRVGIFDSVGGAAVVCGRVSVVYDDGVLVIDLDSGSTMIELGEGMSPCRVGQYVSLEAGAISVFPVDI